MVIIVHSAETKGSIAANIGAKDYSYYFVLEKYRKVLSTIADVVEVRNPEQEVDVIYNQCQAKGRFCLFLSFTPPFKTATELKCPTMSVFAWEYMTIPTDTWGEEPRNDWRNVFRKHGCAITHSSFAVRAVQKAMGEDFPVWSIPAPVWDDYTKLNSKGKTSAPSEGFDLSFKGIVVDFQGCNSVPASEEVNQNFIEQRLSQEGDTELNVHLKGIIYTTVFNPNDGRKNWMDLLWGFIWAFREVEDVTLVMKLAYYDFEAIRAMVINEIQKMAPFKCRVVALHGYLNDHEYAKLVRESTYVVNSAHGEGQCLPLMEYMSAGIPALAPAHTAMEEYINEDNAFVIGSSLEWIPWPHDPRHTLRTFRYRINWESLYHAYLESYQVAKNDPIRYAHMSKCAVQSLKRYCSEAVVKERLKIVLRRHGMKNKDILFFYLRKIRHKASGVLGIIRGKLR
jgi:glycosyltransferase involved in cell wall biosynthesis